MYLVSCSYGSGSRIKLAYTRKIIDAIHSGSLLKAEYKKTKVFGLEIPTEVEGVPSEILDPVNTVSILLFNLLPSIFTPFFCIICFSHVILMLLFSNAVVKQTRLRGHPDEAGRFVQE